MAHGIAVSLVQVLDKLELFFLQFSIPYPKSQIETLRTHIAFFMSEFELKNIESAQDLEKQTIVALYEAQDIIESHMKSTTHLLPSQHGDGTGGDGTFADKLLQVLQKFEPLKEKASTLGYIHRHIDSGREESSPPFVLSRFFDRKKKFVGREDELMKINNQLYGSLFKLKVVAVVGMIGIGKTTLAGEVYNNPLVAHNFSYRAWVSVGPRNGTRDILLSIVKPDHDQEMSTEELAICLGKMLIRKRYIIVLDDMRDTFVWDHLMTFIPENNYGSRIIVTTRLGLFAQHAAKSLKNIHHIPLLNEDESWDLLRYVAIGEQESCPPQLVKIGKTISQRCQGLPLKIIVLGSLLSCMSPDAETWSKVANDRKMQNLEMLKVTQDLYHEQLPQHVKACFLYMIAFPQYQQISVFKLFKLWAAEGFLKPNEFITVKKVAEECLKDLVGRNLVIVHASSSIGEVKICSIHSAIWPFYDRAATEYKIHQSIENRTDIACPSHRRFSIHNNVLFAIKDVYDSIASVANTRSLLCTGPYHPYPLLRVNFMSFRLLKVLDALSIRFYKFPLEILKLVLLRFLGLTLGTGELPTSVSNLALLQFLIVRPHSSIKSFGAPCFLPMEIWSMKELRHLQVTGSDLRAPPPYDETVILPNLLTLSDVSNLSCTKEILERIPHLTKLGIRVELPSNATTPPLHIFDSLWDGKPFHSFDSLAYHMPYKLENLKYVVMNPVLSPSRVLPYSRSVFPSYLKKLTLSGCGFSWKNMNVIALLRNLQVLKLKCHAFRGPEWNVHEVVVFEQLRFLLLEDLDLEHWKADDTNFPELNHLAIHHCYKLCEIPLGLGVKAMLKKIELVECRSSVVDSAMQMKGKRKVGKKGPIVLTHLSWTG